MLLNMPNPKQWILPLKAICYRSWAHFLPWANSLDVSTVTFFAFFLLCCCLSIFISTPTLSISQEIFTLIFIYLDVNFFSFAWSINNDGWLNIDFFFKLLFFSVHFFFLCVFGNLWFLGSLFPLHSKFAFFFCLNNYSLPHFIWVTLEKIILDHFFSSLLISAFNVYLCLFMSFFLHFFNILSFFPSFCLKLSTSIILNSYLYISISYIYIYIYI